MSLLDAAERFASIDRSRVTLDSPRCLHAHDQASECAACFAICPVQAIHAGRPPVLDGERCQSCLACLAACPVGAYHADDDVSSLLNCAAHIEDQAVELLCGLHPVPEKGPGGETIGIRLQGCLAGLGSGAYLMLAALGLERLIARTDACPTCKWHSLGPEIHRQAARANRFLSAWERGAAIHCLDAMDSGVDRAVWEVKNPPLSRRDLFRMLARQGQLTMARAMENGVTGSQRQPGRDRLRLLAAAAYLPAPSGAVQLDEFGFATLSISDACTACGACARACPTDALRFEKNDGGMTFSISFSAGTCIGCDLCDHVCLPDAISIDQGADFERVAEKQEPIVLASGELARCARCRTLMAKREGTDLCPLCEYRRTHPFGSRLPKKAARGPRP